MTPVYGEKKEQIHRKGISALFIFWPGTLFFPCFLLFV